MNIRFLLFLLVVSCMGCGVWNKTTKLYNGYLFKTRVETAKTVSLPPEESIFVNVFYPIDAELERLLRRLNQIEFLPSQAGLDGLCREFPWISGGLVLDDHKEMTASVHLSERQEQVILSKENLRNFFSDQQFALLGTNGVRGCVIYRELKDFFTRKGAVVFLIDLAQLVSAHDSDNRLIMLVPGQVLWGKSHKAADVLSRLDWSCFIKEKIKGRVKVQGEDYYWFVRYLDKQPLIYLFPLARG